MRMMDRWEWRIEGGELEDGELAVGQVGSRGVNSGSLPLSLIDLN